MEGVAEEGKRGQQTHIPTSKTSERFLLEKEFDWVFQNLLEERLRVRAFRGAWLWLVRGVRRVK